MTRNVLVIVHVSVSIWQPPMYLVKHERVERCKVPCENSWSQMAVRTVRGSR